MVFFWLLLMQRQAGVSEKQLQDKDTREFIYGFIEENGGKKSENIRNPLQFLFIHFSCDRNRKTQPVV